jgi:hypothetical protein
VYTITIQEFNSCLSLSASPRPPPEPHDDEVEAYKKEGPKFMQRLFAKQKARVKDS